MASVRLLHNDVSSPTELADNYKVSTLVNAAKISPLVLERTLGPGKLAETKPSIKLNDENCNNVCKASTNNNIQQNGNSPVTPKFRTDVWREVNTEAEQIRSPRNYLQLNDCKLISFRLAANSAEKQRRAKITNELQEKQNKWVTELEQRLQQIRIDSAEEAQQRQQSKQRAHEQNLMDAIKEIEAEAYQAEEKSERQKTKMIEHSRKVIERANQIKQQEEMITLLETVMATKKLFVNFFDSFAKTIITNQAILTQMEKFSDYTKKRDAMLERYEAILNLVNSDKISKAATDAFVKLCENIKQEQESVNNDIESYRKAAEVAVNAAREQVRKEAENVVVVQPNIPTTINHNTANVAPINTGLSVVDGHHPDLTIANTANTIGSAERLTYYSELIQFCEDQESQIAQLLDDVNMKKFRFSCQKAINIPVNAIAAVSPQHLQNKFDKLSQLLAGKHVRVDDVQFTAAEHPLGIQYCTLLLAKKFVHQATTISTSSNPQSAFPIAAVIVSIWQLFPNFGKLFLALLYKECPFLVPFFIPRIQGQSEKAYLTSLGYRFTDDKIEQEDQYLKRLSGLQRLYSAILITKLRRHQQNSMHPHGLENGWIWLSNFLNLNPLPEICATLLLEFISVCGSDMWQVYKKQFTKLLLVLHQGYMVKLDKIDTGGPNARLKILIGNIVRENKIQPPSGTLANNYW